MKKQRNLILLAALVVLAFSPIARANSILADTGLGTQGTIDPNYTLVDPYSVTTGSSPLIQYTSGIYGTLIGGPWVANPEPAQWISPWIQGTPTDPLYSDANPYDYVFQTIAGASGTVSGGFAADNACQIYVNGVYTGITIPPSGYGTQSAFSMLYPFTLTLSAGDIVDFVDDNYAQGGEYGNPAGLLVDVTSQTLPDGGMTVTLLGLAVGVCGLFARKMKKG
jgi:hypothetical protein